MKAAQRKKLADHLRTASERLLSAYNVVSEDDHTTNEDMQAVWSAKEAADGVIAHFGGDAIEKLAEEGGDSLRTVNKVILIGNVGLDPDVRVTPEGRKEARLSLSTASKGSDRQRKDWHRVVLFGKLAMIADDYVCHGDLVYVEGHLQYGSFELDGVTTPTTEIIAGKLVLLDQ